MSASSSSSLVASSVAAAAVTTWTTKAGTVKTRASSLGALSAPKSAQVAAAVAADLSRWTNGNCAAVVRDIRALLTDKQALAVATAATLNPANKPDSLAFLAAARVAMLTNAKGEAIEAKGEKARFVSLVDAITAHETERETARAAAAVASLAGAGAAGAGADSLAGADSVQTAESEVSAH